MSDDQARRPRTRAEIRAAVIAIIEATDQPAHRRAGDLMDLIGLWHDSQSGFQRIFTAIANRRVAAHEQADHELAMKLEALETVARAVLMPGHPSVPEVRIARWPSAGPAQPFGPGARAGWGMEAATEDGEPFVEMAPLDPPAERKPDCTTCDNGAKWPAEGDVDPVTWDCKTCGRTIIPF